MSYPTPHEYALMSKAIYADDLRVQEEDATLPKDQHTLYQAGWRLNKFISLSNDYRGGIFVHQEKKQVVLAHRGSQNLTSWITDYESIIQQKPGGFTKTVIELLSDNSIITLRQQGYRFSTTGHSLGGFLAQVCVYWSQRSEFTASYYPEMSAVVFDSPGVVEFLKVLQSNIKSERGRVKIERLNIHNFCPMPTVVSTYGTQTGTLWHLSEKQEMRFASVMAHKMDHILSGFDESTGMPKIFSQMRDWPQADYSKYSSADALLSSATKTAISLPFATLNALYEKIKDWAGYKRDDTWYDQIFREKPGEFSSFLSEMASNGYVPKDNSALKQISQAIESHYAHDSKQANAKTIGLHHFDPATQKCLLDLEKARLLGDHDWQSALSKKYGEVGAKLLNSFKLSIEGDKTDLMLTVSYSGTVFEFQNAISRQLMPEDYKEFPSFLLEQLNDIKNALPQNNDAVTLNLRAAIASVENSFALKMTEKEDYAPERITEAVNAVKELRDQGFNRITVNSGGAEAKEAGCVAVVMPSGAVDQTAAILAQSLMGMFKDSMSNNPKEGNDNPAAGATPSKKGPGN